LYVAQIKFEKRLELDRDKASDAINGLLSALRMNGQVCGREVAVIDTPDYLMATELIPEIHSLDTNHHNQYVLRDLQILGELGLSGPSIEVAREMDGHLACECAVPASYILYTNYLTLESSLWCGDCFHPVPLYRIPPTSGKEYNDIIGWQSNYKACDTLQMLCTQVERTALRQMSWLDSGLTKDGLDICRRIKEVTQTPTYYYLYRHYGRSKRDEARRRCPSCQGEWLLAERWHIFDFRCDRCELLSNIAVALP